MSYNLALLLKRFYALFRQVFKDRVKIMTVNYSEKDQKSSRDNFDHHKGAQVELENPMMKILKFPFFIGM